MAATERKTVVQRHAISDPVADYFSLCRDSEGRLNDALIQYAISAAYRAGFDACRSRIPKITMDHCPVGLLPWPADEARIAKLADEFKRDLDGRTPLSK